MENLSEPEKQEDADKTLVPSAAPNPIPVIEEQLHINKKWEKTGLVQILKTVTEENISFEESVITEDINIEKKEINQYVEIAPPTIRHEDDKTIISVLKEVLVVEKKLMLLEELHITKRKTEKTISGTETLRKENIEVNRTEIKR